jgi:hypothetical protein
MEPPKTSLNVEAKEIAPKRKEAISAQENIRKIVEEEEQSKTEHFKYSCCY